MPRASENKERRLTAQVAGSLQSRVPHYRPPPTIPECYLEKTNLDGRLLCPECLSPAFHTSRARGETVCAGCGLVVETILMSGTPTPTYQANGGTGVEQYGPPIRTRTPGLAVVNRMTPASHDPPVFRRLFVWNNRLSHSERHLLAAVAEMTRLVSLLRLVDNFVDWAADVYKRAHRQHLGRGHSIEAMSAASVYTTCRLQREPRFLSDIMLHTEKTEKEIRRCTQAIAFNLGLRFPAFDPTGFVARFSSELGLSTEIERTAQRVAFEFTCRSRQQLQGKDPKGVIAASIYYACQLHNHSYSQTVIGGHIGTTEVTLRTRLTEIRDFLLLHPLPLIA